MEGEEKTELRHSLVDGREEMEEEAKPAAATAENFSLFSSLTHTKRISHQLH